MLRVLYNLRPVRPTRLGALIVRIFVILALSGPLAANSKISRINLVQKGTAGSKQARQLLQADDSTDTGYDVILATPLSEVIPNQYIVALHPNIEDAATAAALLVSDVEAALHESALEQTATDELPTGVDTVQGTAPTHIQLVKVLNTRHADSMDSQGPTSEAAIADVPQAASMHLAVLSISAAALVFVQQSQLVAAVVPDLVVRALPMQCLGPTNITQGVSTTPTVQFQWPGCYTSRARLVWRGVTCRDGTSVYWNQIRAVDRATNAIIVDPQRRQCILYPSVDRTSNLNLFGACGVAPRFAPTLPTTLCSSAGGGGGGGDATPGTLPRMAIRSGESVPKGLLRVEAVTSAGVANVSAGLPLTVGIMDSGIDATHPDLNYVGGSSWVTASPALPADAQPGVDAFVAGLPMGWFLSSVGCLLLLSCLAGHGTHVAGTVGAKNNGQGLVGVAPGAALYSLKMLNGAGSGSLSDAMAAISWVASPTGGRAKGIRVVNLSFAGYVDPASANYQDSLKILCAPFKAASDAGVATVAAAGNYGSSIAGWLPAACPTVLAVTAVDGTTKAAASFSNFLPTTASAAEQATVIAAPGTGINSTISYTKALSGYNELSGTSVACPHVTGIIATCLMSSACPANSTGSAMYAVIQAAAKERLAQTTKPAFGFKGDATGSVNGKYYGYMACAKY